MTDFTNAPTLVQFERQEGDGVTVSYSIAPHNETDATKFIVALDGVKQRAVTDYDLVETDGETALVFTTAPELGTAIDMVYLQYIQGAIDPMHNKKFSEFRQSDRLPVTGDYIVGLQDGDNVRFDAGLLNVNAKNTGVLPIVTPRQYANGTQVYFDASNSRRVAPSSFSVRLDGVVQAPYEDFGVSDAGDIVFLEAPPLGTAVDITCFEPNVAAQTDTVESILLFEKYILEDKTITGQFNGLSVSPTVTDGVTVTVDTDSTYVVL